MKYLILLFLVSCQFAPSDRDINDEMIDFSRGYCLGAIQMYQESETEYSKLKGEISTLNICYYCHDDGMWSEFCTEKHGEDFKKYPFMERK